MWKFGFEKARKLEITALCWNPTYNDLFAAGFGSCNMTRMAARTDNDSLVADNFYEQTEPGVVCVFSLKNPSYPEFLCHAPCGVMCLDFHPEVSPSVVSLSDCSSSYFQHPHMLVVGLYDGNIAVYNLQKNVGVPNYQSDAKNGKHRDIVWQVYHIDNTFQKAEKYS